MFKGPLETDHEPLSWHAQANASDLVFISYIVFTMRTATLLSLALATLANAATPDQWRGRTIYQVITDRFARTDGSTTYTCNSENRAYCGGTWQGLINHLDYIQGLGISAVYSLCQKLFMWLMWFSSGYPPLPRIFREIPEMATPIMVTGNRICTHSMPTSEQQTTSRLCRQLCINGACTSWSTS